MSNSNNTSISQIYIGYEEREHEAYKVCKHSIKRFDTGLINTSNLKYVASSTGHSEYKISGSNKKGRWIQFKLEDMTSSLNSVGLLFRRKSIK